MKIAIIPSWYNSPSAPARGSFIRAQAEGLQARGHDVLVLALDRDSDRKLLSLAEKEEDGVRCIRISVPAPWHRLLGFYMPRVLASIIKKQIIKFAPNIVHAHAARPAGVLAYHAMVNQPIPYVLTEHSGPLSKFWWTPHGKRQITLAYQNASALFAVSNFLRREMDNRFENITDKTTVLFNGVDTEIFVPGNRAPERGKLLFVGALEKEKGLHILLSALATISDSLKWTLTVIGIGKYERRLRRQASKLGISDRIEWAGVKFHLDMPSIYELHDFVVVPSLHETFSMVCAEALACARPVIATHCGGPEEVVPSFAGKLVPPGEANALSKILSEVLRGSSSFELGRAVQHVRQKFSMETLLDNLETSYTHYNGSGD